jgi:hypothetical protein
MGTLGMGCVVTAAGAQEAAHPVHAALQGPAAMLCERSLLDACVCVLPTLRVSPPVCPPTHSFTLQGAPALIDVETVPEAGPNGQGRIGVRLSANSYINHVKAPGPAEAVRIANAEFIR